MKYLWILFIAFPLLVQGDQLTNENIVNTTPDTRYHLHQNGTVTDIVTGLMWKQCSQGLSGSDCSEGVIGAYNWQAAFKQAEGATDAGYTDWRLPNIKELVSLVALDRSSPSINISAFPNTPTIVSTSRSEFFWSSSPYLHGGSDDAWLVEFYRGSYLSRFRSSLYSVRLVRDVVVQ